ncbi:MAG: M48 family metallopeptidase [Burkholderiales bacterium]|nr:MAG: M48 family metallopeptidase [Burkholderiales bacterium]
MSEPWSIGTGRRFWVALLAALLLAGCQSVRTTQPGAVGVDRKQQMSPLVSEAQLREVAAQQYSETLTETRKKGDLNADPGMTRRVRAIADRLIPQTGAFRADAPSWQWEVNVIRSDQLNAWCMPGGKIAVYTGIIDKLRLSDDEIAAIMGHEIAHALREHARERVSEQVTANTAISIGAAVLGLGRSGADLAGALYNVTFRLPNSRLHESEADRMGVELAARAGYDPRAAVSLWNKMVAHSGNGPPEVLSTHPAPASRIRDLQTYAERVMPLYRQARPGR